MLSDGWMRGKTLDQLIDSPLQSALGVEVADAVEACVLSFESQQGTASKFHPRSMKNFLHLQVPCLDGSQNLLSCSVLRCSNPNTFLIEFEEVSFEESNDKAVMSPPDDARNILLSGDLAERIRVTNSILEVTNLFCSASVDILSDYDRGMVYKFDQDGTGIVIAESIKPGITLPCSYLNLRYNFSGLISFHILRYINRSTIIAKFYAHIDVLVDSPRSISHPLHAVCSWKQDYALFIM